MSVSIGFFVGQKESQEKDRVWSAAVKLPII